MVSKVAVMALVAVLAVPILLGYGLSLNETAQTTYTPGDKEVNVSQLLQRETGYTYAHGDPYTLNTKTSVAGETTVHPFYEQYGTNKSGVFGLRANNFPVNPNTSNRIYIYNYSWLDVIITQSSNGGEYVTLRIYEGNNVVVSSTEKLISLNYDNLTKTLSYTTRDGINPGYHNYTYTVTANSTTFDLTTVGGWSGTAYNYWHYSTEDTNSQYWANLSKGFHFTDIGRNIPAKLVLPNYTKSFLFTVNLDSYAFNYNANYIMNPGSYQKYLNFNKTVVDGETTWVVGTGLSQSSPHYTLYYDPTRSDNTYQVSVELTKDMEDDTYRYYTYKMSLYYVGGWPSNFGKANYFMNYDFEETVQVPLSAGEQFINGMTYAGAGGSMPARSLTMRVDDAYFRAFEYPVMANRTYTPAMFRDNPITTINTVNQYGDSIVFAGNTYSVGSDGNITLGTHKASVKNIVFDSRPIPGGYENRINGNVISVTAEPSTIRFNGTWGIDIVTDSQTATTYTKTEWIPGEFAWDGIDQNFLMVGLITCLGVFIGLGIYLRKTKSSIWPLLIVCGCAAGLFICMI